MNEKTYLKGSLLIKKYEKKKLIEEHYCENLITDSGLLYLMRLIGNDESNGINKLALGDGIIAPKKTDKSLQNIILLADVQKDYSIFGRVNFMVNVSENTFNRTVGYNEAGLVSRTGNNDILITRLVLNDTVYQKPENSISFLYSLELRV